SIEFESGNGDEERDTTPPSETDKAGKFWVYEQAIRIPFYAIFDTWRDSLEVYHLVDGRYIKVQPNDRGHFAIAPMGVELGLKLENGVSWLRWWDESGNLLLTGDERAAQAEAIADQQRTIADQERQQKEKLANYLRSIGVDPDAI
ncbi:MAG: Uma2 family endonuclease, partial [Pseudanabaena sp.]